MRTSVKIAIVAGAVVLGLVALCLLSSLSSGSNIHCWVKVVDQEGKGVNGYKVRVRGQAMRYAFSG